MPKRLRFRQKSVKLIYMLWSLIGSSISKVHATFGHTLMLAGVTRIIEICVFAPKLSGDVDDDSKSDHTLNATTESGSYNSTYRAFRHLPPFVSTHTNFFFQYT